MPLDWNFVKEKYGRGYQVPTCAGGKFLKIASQMTRPFTLSHPYGRPRFTVAIWKKEWR